MTPAECRDEFVEALGHCRELCKYAVENITDDDVRSLTYESALSRTFRAYENFAEAVFLAYMIGEPTASGSTAARYVSPPSSEHARRMLQGKAQFLDWADPATVIDRCKYFLDHEGPLSTAVIQATNTLDRMRKIRNHVAHNSVESLRQYRKVVTALILVDPSTPPRPGELLQCRPQRGPYRGREVLAALFSEIESFVNSAVE